MKKLLEVELAGLEEELKQKIREAAETIEAIKNNEIDAFVVNTGEGAKVLTLQVIENLYNTILDNLNMPAITFSEEGKIIYANKQFYEILDLENDKVVKGSSIYEIISPVSYPLMESYLLNPSGEQINEIGLIRSDETVIKFSITSKIISSEGIQPFILLMVNRDAVSRNEETEQGKFAASELIATVVCDNEGNILRLNRSAIILSGKTFENNTFDSTFNLTDFEDKNMSVKDLPYSKEQSPYEVIFKRKDGRIFYIDLTKEPLKDLDGNNRGFVITLIDMTKHILAESKAQESLKEKNMLIKEVHHRVKNSLQIISSIINLQAYYLTDPVSQGIFSELKTRLRSISLVHEKLYQSDNIKEIRLDNYILELINFIKDSYNLEKHKITFSYNIDPIFFEMDRAVHVGLIITEAITNSIKYAFPQKEGEIRLVLKQEGDKLKLIIKDNGIGLPENLNIHEAETLGLQLINSISQQMNGKIKITNKNGTEIQIIFAL